MNCFIPLVFFGFFCLSPFILGSDFENEKQKCPKPGDSVLGFSKLYISKVDKIQKIEMWLDENKNTVQGVVRNIQKAKTYWQTVKGYRIDDTLLFLCFL